VPTDALRETLFFELDTDRVVAKVGQLGETVGETEDEEHRRVVAERDARIPFLHLVEGHPTDRGALGEEGRRNPPAKPSVPDVMPELEQGAANRYGDLGA
jgi:hypothetical protein